MSLDEKLEFFQLLVDVGFKMIEVGFPAASETEYQFLRTLIEQNMIPDNVTIQVLTQAREHIIRKTFDAVKGAPHAIIHVYNSIHKKCIIHLIHMTGPSHMYGIKVNLYMMRRRNKMKYLLMVGHGQFPPGLHNALTMFASDTPDLMYCNLENGMDTDKYVENLKKKLEVIDPQKDEIIILSDLPGGSPLTNVIAVLGEMEMLEHCVIYTGMNLPLAINVVMTKDSTTLDKLDELVLADTQAKRFVLETDEDDEI